MGAAYSHTSKEYTQDQLRYDFQATAYELAARQAGMGNVGVRFYSVACRQ